MIVLSRHRSSLILLPLLAVALLLLAPAPANGQAGSAWDHYKVYRVIPSVPFSAPVTLTDQFGTTQHTVKELIHFANPVEKTHDDGTGGSGPIIDPRTHYAWWSITTVPFSRVIVADNQFGSQTLQLSNAVFLLNPALKNEQGALPEENHYKCYNCQGAAVNVPVTMTDQFGSWQANVTAPRYFCNPVKKELTGLVFPIVDPGQHYVCYEFTPVDTRVFSATISDQFLLDRGVQLDLSRYLCVPTDKVDPTPTSNETWGRLKILYR